ncbi:SRPBCC family protein [Kribbella deserti]|uniref:SRPBCC domain-containing protein n=1 Tax=Kribbella deserti TaxID=1926257 RepID=A0ABV6QRS3_9ACTN
MIEQGASIVQEFDQSAREVFAAVVDVRGWWSKNITGGTAMVGDEFEYDVPVVHHSRIRVSEVVPERLVVWRVLENTFSFETGQDEWAGTEVRFEISTTTSGGRTELRFTHVGLLPEFECYDICHKSWTFYVGHSLRKLITTGTGLPNEIADDVEVIGARMESVA